MAKGPKPHIKVIPRDEERVAKERKENWSSGPRLCGYAVIDFRGQITHKRPMSYVEGNDESS